MLLPPDWTSAPLGHLALWVLGSWMTSLSLPLLLVPCSLGGGQGTQEYARTMYRGRLHCWIQSV